MNKQEYDALWWQYFAECGSSCGLPLPTRIPETMGMVTGYVGTMLQAFGASATAGNITVGGFLNQLAFKSPATYQWAAKTFPTLVRIGASRAMNAGIFSTGSTGTMRLGARALVASEVGAVTVGTLASAYLGFVLGAAAYASLRIRGFDLGAEGTAASDFFAWQTGNNNLGLFDWWSGALASEQQGEDLRLRLATRKSRIVQALARAEARHRIKVPAAIHAKIRNAR